MKIHRIGFILPLLLLSGCAGHHSDVVNRQYVHKYGFQVAGEDWASRGQDGQVITTLETGEKVTENYAGGKLHGETTTTFPHSSVVAMSQLYDNGELLKTATYGLNGWPIWEERYQQNGTTEHVNWYATGAPQSVEVIQDDKILTGEYYTLQNQLESRVEQGEGVRIIREAYGTHVKNLRISNGQETAEHIYHPNGILASETPFKNGVVEGVRLTYLPSGEPNTSETWIQGKQHGLTVVYLNGQVWREVPYVNGVKEGVESVYRDGSQLVEEISWMGDLQHGPHKRYIDGMMKTEWYYKGELMPKSAHDQLIKQS